MGLCRIDNIVQKNDANVKLSSTKFYLVSIKLHVAQKRFFFAIFNDENILFIVTPS